MRKLVTAAAAALTLSTMALATPAFADHDGYRPGRPNADQPYKGPNGGPGYGNPGHGNPGYGNPGHGNPGYGNPGHNNYDDDHRGDNHRGDRWRDRRFDFDRHGGRFDSWERGWRHDNRWGPRHGQSLNYWQIVRRLERQGFYGVRGLRPARHGWGWRAFAFTGRGHPVMLRINPYTGRVIDVRYV